MGIAAAEETSSARTVTGIPGLDDVLGGGLPSRRMYLVQGTPGAGKTTLALQFLIEGARRGERALYITLSETEDEIRQVADSHGWSLDGVTLYELSTAEQSLRLGEENTLYSTADIELRETMRVLLEEVDRVNPHRVVFDSLSEIRLLAQTAIRYRRQLLGVKQYFAGKSTTVLLLDDRSADAGDIQVESLAHGVVLLEQSPTRYGADRRRLRVSKLRGSSFRTGHHDFVVQKGGIAVFPRLVAAEHRSDFVPEAISSGIARLDDILGGGLDRSTATLLLGPAGTGKSAIAAQFACAAASRGDRAVIFAFEERIGTLRVRCNALGMSFDEHLASGRIHVHQVDPAELAPDQFTHLVRHEVENNGARVVIIDSINGYFSSMPEAHFLTLQMHELLAYLADRGAATILTMAQAGVIGTMNSPVDVSYLADNVILLRYFEAEGRARKAISMLKKRSGMHENTIRELTLGRGGISLGEPLSAFRGVLSGIPVPLGGAGERSTDDHRDQR